ncbi:TPA: DNA primase [Salmonella enterica subsp. salamae serovar 35:g,m,s,t:-]|nr:DNA primase [Salmonella enterica subsp. salamae serovar 35:g,m,s,t:-]HCA3549690.1 DNA primase [Salmonella enterica subsp. salamae serovar 35:g,m,s,t:-]
MSYPNGFLSQLKGKANIVSIVGKDIDLKKSGSNLVGLCPFHSDSLPSLRVSLKRGTYKCFACDSGGDVLDWLQHYNKSSFGDAVKLLCEITGTELPPMDTYTAEEKQLWGQLSRALSKAQIIYTRGLQKSNLHREYLYQRGITDQTIKKFGLGVVGKGIAHFLKEDGFSEEVLLKAGIIATNEKGSTYDALRNRITIPLYSASGHLIGFSGRKGDGISGPKYLNTAETVLFKKSHELYGLHLAKPAIYKTDTAVIVEGYFDVISLHQAGEKRAIATMGTALTKEHLAVIFSHAKFLVLCFDGDKAGMRAAKNASKALLENFQDGMNISFIFLPEQQDPDDYIRKNGIDAWHATLNSAMQLSHFLLKMITYGGVPDSVEAITKSSLRAKSVLACINKDRAPIYYQALSSAIERTLGIKLQVESSNG